jgi:RNA polymerase sigma-70 factor, ECF subfamily
MTHAVVFDIRVLALGERVERDVRDVRDEELAGLLARFADGDLDALGPIYDSCASELFAIAHWRTGSVADASDCVQDVFVKLAGMQAMAAGIRNPRRYLLTMAHRAAVNRVRKRRPRVALDDAPFLEAPGPDPDRVLDASRATTVLRGLPEAQREAVYLHHFAELSFREVGSVTGVPTFTAASRYRLGIARLRELLGERR